MITQQPNLSLRTLSTLSSQAPTGLLQGPLQAVLEVVVARKLHFFVQKNSNKGS